MGSRRPLLSRESLDCQRQHGLVFSSAGETETLAAGAVGQRNTLADRPIRCRTDPSLNTLDPNLLSLFLLTTSPLAVQET